MTVGAGCCVRLAAWSVSSRQAQRPSTADRIMGSEIPVIRATAGGICSPSGSAIKGACASVMVVPRTRAQPISRRWPRGAAAVAWQSTTSTSSCESGWVGLASTIATTAPSLSHSLFVRLLRTPVSVESETSNGSRSPHPLCDRHTLGIDNIVRKYLPSAQTLGGRTRPGRRAFCVSLSITGRCRTEFLSSVRTMRERLRAGGLMVTMRDRSSTPRGTRFAPHGIRDAIVVMRASRPLADEGKPPASSSIPFAPSTISVVPRQALLAPRTWPRQPSGVRT